MPFSALEGIAAIYLWYSGTILFERVFVWIVMPAKDSFFVCLCTIDLYTGIIRGPPDSFISNLYEMEEDYMSYILLDREKLNKKLENNRTEQALTYTRSQCLYFFAAKSEPSIVVNKLCRLLVHLIGLEVILP